MIIDTSAIVAVIKREEDSEFFYQKMLDADSVKVSTATLVELELVLRGAPQIADLLTEVNAIELPVDSTHLYWARYAVHNFARGSGSAAKLNLGDCFSYAASRAAGEPLLFKGTDFGSTDVLVA